MAKSVEFIDHDLVALLQKLLSEDQLPPIDRWFSHWAKIRKWDTKKQKSLWLALNRCLLLGFWACHQMESEKPPRVILPDSWNRVRSALKGSERTWAIWSRNPIPVPPDRLSAGIPDWLGGSLEKRTVLSKWDEKAQEAFLTGQLKPALTAIRFAPGELGAQARLELLTLGARIAEIQPGIEVIDLETGLMETQAWKSGGMDIQDASSQRVGFLLNARPGMRVWDACCGRGGKTLLLADELRGKGVLVATDVMEYKIQTLRKRLKKSSYSNVRTFLWDGQKLPDFGLEVEKNGGFDRVLVDAPCSATGTWRRDSEARFRINRSAIRELNVHQNRLIRLGWQALKKGGKLIYATCSWLPEENEEIVRKFVEESGAALIHEVLLGLPAFDANTMYVAILEKKG